MIKWALPGPLSAMDGMQQPLPSDGSDVSVVAVALFAVHGVAFTAVELEALLRTPRRISGEIESKVNSGGLTRFYQCLDECLSIEDFKISGVPVELMPTSDLLVDAEHKVSSTVQSGRHEDIRRLVAKGNYVHHLIGEDIGFRGDNVLVADAYFNDHQHVFNDTRPTIARAWRDLRLTSASTKIVLKRFESAPHQQPSVAQEAQTPQVRSRIKPGPHSDEIYISEHAAKAFPNGIPAGMSMTEAREKIRKSMRATMADGQNRRTPVDRTFKRHGY